jgi:prepilin-type N-terminal cleavage/methylation domain-containing protein
MPAFMTSSNDSQRGLTLPELIFSIALIAILTTIYFLLVDSFSDQRLSEQAAKVLMQAAKAQEDFFIKEHRYFDAETSSASGDSNLTTSEGIKTSVLVPPRIIVSLKSRGAEKRAFSGYSYCLGGKLLHKYDSESGKIKTVQRDQGDSG